MTELQFSRREIEDLAQKLDSPQSQLSARERTLLLAIFSAARGAVQSSPAPGPGTPAEGPGSAQTLTNLREQLVNAFIPGGGTDFTMASPRIGPGT
jgi:hypothetical protein